MADQGQTGELFRSSDIRLELLGPVRLGNSANDVLTPRARKTRALLAVLALSKAPLTRSRLTDLLWGHRGEEQAKASLRQALYELRDLASRGFISADRETVAIGPKPLPTDLATLQQTIERGDSAALGEALRDIGSPLLGTLDGITPELDDWLRDERSGLCASITKDSVAIARWSLERGDAAVARQIADQLERLEPLDEPVAQLGIRADLAAGDRSAASRRHARFTERLQAQLGIQPAADTDALLRGDVAGSAPRAAAHVANRTEPFRTRPKRYVVALAIALVALVTAGLTYVLVRPSSAAATPTVAVLPFDDLGLKSEDYFASGVSEEILNLLGHQQSLKVLGRISAEQLARGANPLTRARELGVSYVLDGSVRTADGQALVIARLTRVADGSQVWSERYQRRIGDIFAVQGDIAGSVASRVAQSFAPSRPQGTRPEVYDRYLAARQLVRERREVTLEMAERLLRQAIALDPHYAPAFAELSQAIMLRADHPTAYGSLPVADAKAEARPFAIKAHNLDPTLGDAYAAMGFLSVSFAPESEAYFRRAVELSPQSPEFHRWHGEALANEGRYDEAIAEYRRAVEIDPLWGLSYDHLIGALRLVGRNDEAQRYLSRFLALSTDQRAKLLLLHSAADDDSRLADEYKITAQLVRNFPQERQSRFDFASVLGELGERKKAFDLMKSDDVGAAALSSNWPMLARAATTLGSEYWNISKFWNAGNLLVQSGHGDVVVAMYDRDHGLVASGAVNPRDMINPATVVALRRAGRSREADGLLQQMRSIYASFPDRGLLGIDKSVKGILLAALSGDRERAIRGLDEISRRDPLTLTYNPAMALRYDPALAPLSSDPRFPAIEDRVRVALNRSRHDVGLPPISRSAWISDPNTLLTKN
jgi:DNA-binding SARP family transcriptional activator/TolB-like protein/tetratricopeptide (TPR) repeat protein